MKDLISVIVPVYNVEPFIASCLDSLSKQNYQNFKVLLVNDGSTDNSGAICREYADRDSRFHYFEKENGDFRMHVILESRDLKEIILHL